MEKRWTVKECDEDLRAVLQEALPNVNPIIHTLLAQRQVKTYEEAKAFFRPKLSLLHDPFLMAGMAEAVKRITDAFEWHERILIFGDYDVDGTTAVSVVWSFLHAQFPTHDIEFYIPHRDREGYGVSQAGIDFAIEKGYTLMITLDCGIKSAALVTQANKRGLDVIICDHHLPDESLPPAVAILNPKQTHCTYPYKELSGCGIGFKLIQALAAAWKLPEKSYLKYLDLVATSIAADIVPIDGENRLLAYFGMKMVNETPSLGIKTLVRMAGVTRKLFISDLVFVIGPRVNAAGRMDDARKAVQLFIEEDAEKSQAFAEALNSDNTDRREVDKNITEEALEILQNNGAPIEKNSTVLFNPEWHKGVVGIVASRLMDHFYRPTIVLTESNGKASGSARSVRGFNIYEAIDACSDLLENYGGHFYAAGMTMLTSNVKAFQQRFEDVVTSLITPEQKIPEVEIDAELNFNEITPRLYSLIKQMEPFGPANMRPVFMSRNVRDYRGYSRVLKDAHIKFVMQQPRSRTMDGIGFGLADKYEFLEKGPVDLVYTIDENEYNGEIRLQIKVIDIRPAEAKDE